MPVTPDLVVATAQFTAGNDVPDNLARIDRLMSRAGGLGARLVVFPEASMTAWNVPADQLSAQARAWGERFEAEILALARKHQMVVVAGSFVAGGSDDRPRNRLVVAGPEGLLGRYDKVHHYDAFGYAESDRVAPASPREDGSELVVVPVGGFRVGVLNCYDLRFPEMAAALSARGADLLAVSSAWVAGPHKEMHWELLLRARAVENTCYVVGSCQPPPSSTGSSMLVDPMGLVLGTCAEDDDIVATRLSRARLDRVRAELPVLANRRYRVVPAHHQPETPMSASSPDRLMAVSSSRE